MAPAGAAAATTALDRNSGYMENPTGPGPMDRDISTEYHSQYHLHPPTGPLPPLPEEAGEGIPGAREMDPLVPAHSEIDDFSASWTRAMSAYDDGSDIGDRDTHIHSSNMGPGSVAALALGVASGRNRQSSGASSSARTLDPSVAYESGRYDDEAISPRTGLGGMQSQQRFSHLAPTDEEGISPRTGPGGVQSQQRFSHHLAPTGEEGISPRTGPGSVQSQQSFNQNRFSQESSISPGTMPAGQRNRFSSGLPGPRPSQQQRYDVVDEGEEEFRPRDSRGNYI